jgi:hypothetical protein
MGGPCYNNAKAYVLEYFDGDTTINLLKYRIIREKYLGCYSGSCGDCNVYYKTYLREDTVENKVYLYVNGNDTLIYDYNWQVGDTVEGWHADPNGWITVTIAKVDTIFLRNKNRRVWTFGGIYQKVVEGYGTSGCGVKAPVFGFEYEAVYLTCLNDTIGPVLYPNLYTGSPCFPYSVEENTTNTGLHIYPNPAQTGFTLQIKEYVLSDVSITVRNTLGKICYQQTITSQEHYINTETWAKGIYFIEASSENTLLGRQKLVKH